MINQYICGESIRFILFFFSIFLVYFQENLSLSMPENMTCLMEECKPELIIGFITQAKLHQCFHRG